MVQLRCFEAHGAEYSSVLRGAVALFLYGRVELLTPEI
jgi:hypothetical protein